MYCFNCTVLLSYVVYPFDKILTIKKVKKKFAKYISTYYLYRNNIEWIERKREWEGSKCRWQDHKAIETRNKSKRHDTENSKCVKFTLRLRRKNKMK